MSSYTIPSYTQQVLDKYNAGLAFSQLSAESGLRGPLTYWRVQILLVIGGPKVYTGVHWTVQKALNDLDNKLKDANALDDG